MPLIKRLAKLAALFAIAAAAIYYLLFRPIAVHSHIIQRQSVAEEVLGTGTLEARVSATISSKIAGRVLHVLVDQGDRVDENQPLVALEDEELQGQVSIAQANLEAVVAGLQRLREDRKRAEIIADQAQRSLARVDELSKQNAISQEEVDKAQEALALGLAGVSLSEAAINEGQKELVAAEKSLDYQRARLADTQIQAPFSGLVVRREREPGDVVVPGSQILSIISLEEMWISAWVDETAISLLQVDQPARVVFRSLPDHSFEGRVSRLGREADRETREFIVDVRVLNFPKNWAVGQRAEVYIQTDTREACLALPVEFLRRQAGAEGVYVLRGGQAVWQQVEIGLRGRQAVEVLSGLAAGDRVLRTIEASAEIPTGRTVQIK